MGRITSGTGLVSGINSASIIEQLMSLEARPKTLIQQRMDTANKQKLAFTDLSTRLTSLRLSVMSLKKPLTFQARTVNSTNENVLTATASAGAAKGTYQFQVARLVSSQQAITAGFSQPGEKVGAGTLTIEMGGGEISSTTQLTTLNGGDGVRRGTFRISDRSGRSGVIDISTAISLDDVVKKINTSLDVSVRASIDGDSLKIADLSGSTASNLIISDLAGGSAAADLGIAASVASSNHTGTSINRIGRNTTLASLNDGRGVRLAAAGADVRITNSAGATFDVALAGKNTVGAVLDAVNAATGGTVTASFDPGSHNLKLTDSAGGGGTMSAVSLNNSQAVKDLGLDRAAVGNVIAGRDVQAGLNTILLSSLRGGLGLNLGTFSITDRAGNAAGINLAGATTVQDVLDAINANGTAQVRATLKESGNGIQLVDTSGGTGSLVIADTVGTSAAELGLSGTFANTVPTVRGANLQRQWLNENTLLSTLNGGRGVTAGKFKLTNSAGATADVDLTQGNETTIRHVIDEINAKNIGITAGVNANGDGIVLTDAAGGGGFMSVTDLSGRAAADLNLAGTATSTTLDGSYEKTLVLDANDSLQTAHDKLNALAYGVSATIINDGSAGTPLRLSLSARNSGLAGRFVFDAGATNLNATNLIDAQDAAVFYGSAGAANPLVITSSTNQLTNVVRGVTIDLHGASNAPVTLNVGDSNSNVVGDIKKFVEAYNGLVDKLKDLTKYDQKTNTRGLLLGDSAAQRVQTELSTMLQSVVSDAGSVRLLSDVGLRLGEGAKLELNEERFQAAYAKDPEAVRKFFTMNEAAVGSSPAKKGIGTILEERINRLIDPVDGVITRQNRTLDDKTEDFEGRITQLDKIIASKRARLERQFANLESVLANLQSQQQSLSAMSFIAPATGGSKGA